MNNFRRFTVLFLVIIISVTLMTGCGEVEKIPTKEEIIEEATVLLNNAVEVNRIFFWEGLPHEDPVTGEEAGDVEYLTLTEDYMYLLESDLLAKAEAVYTEKYCNDINSIAFEGIKVTDDDALYARYIVEGGVMKINRKLSEEGLKERIPDTDSIQVVEVNENLAIVNLSFSCEGEIEKQNVTMRLEENGWRLDTPTY